MRHYLINKALHTASTCLSEEKKRPLWVSIVLTMWNLTTARGCPLHPEYWKFRALKKEVKRLEDKLTKKEGLEND